MKTPICDFVKKYSDKRLLRLHMPGHKGKALTGPEGADITEIDGADVLYTSTGIISLSQKNAASLFGTYKTVYSAEGSSLSIRAMLYLVLLCARAKGVRPVIAAGRNAHKVFITAAALLDIDVEWLYSEKALGMVSCKITPEGLKKQLSSMKEPPTAVYITSPDYLGNISDVGGLAKVCHERGILLLVDNAHGAYLNFLPESLHPIALGADLCCDSAHKTLPALTGAAYLHVSDRAPNEIKTNAETAMSLFASTSPSYLILQSLDAVNGYISNGYREKLSDFCKVSQDLKRRLADHGYTLTGDEPLKITILTKPFGYTGHEISAIMESRGAVCEFSDPDAVVMMLSPEFNAREIDIISEILLSIERKEPITSAPPSLPTPKVALSPKAAITSLSEEIDVERSLGRVLAQVSVSCPPAIPVAVCGETIDRIVIDQFRYYGIKKCRVVIQDTHSNKEESL